MTLLQVGVSSKVDPCIPCNPGSYSSNEGATECVKCTQNQYQDEKGQPFCKNCSKDQFSRIGETKCSALPECELRDFYVKPLSIKTCEITSGGVYMRKQISDLPKWPGKKVIYG